MSRMEDAEHRRQLDRLARALIDQGLLIEAGFASLRAVAMSRTAPPEQVIQMRLAFFAGAQHLFGSLMQALDPDAEPTADDERRMSCISAELDRFIEEFQAQHMPTKGSA